MLRIIAIQNPDSGEAVDLQKIPDFPQKALRLVALALLFFNIYTINHGVSSSQFRYFRACSARLPMSLRR